MDVRHGPRATDFAVGQLRTPESRPATPAERAARKDSSVPVDAERRMPDSENPYDRPEFVARYARARPSPPRDLVPLLVELSRRARPRLVVDLGCGTGLSTNIWSGRASRVVGVDNNPNMLGRARPRPGVEYRLASASDTGLPSGSADIVTCSQSFHWMPPRTTIPEIARILRPGGVFAACDYAMPPIIDPMVDPPFTRLLRWSGVPDLPEEKARHLVSLERSRYYRWVRSIALHHRDVGNARRVTDLALSVAHVAARLPEGAPGTDPRFRALQRAAERALGTDRRGFWWTFRVDLAVK